MAAGNTATRIASALEVTAAEPEKQALERISRLAKQYQVQGIVVGWPLNMDDSEGPQGKLARQMACKLASATHLDVRMWDERLSSFEADQILAGRLTRKKKKARQDAVAAAVMLQDFLLNDGEVSAPRPDELGL